MSAQLPGYDSMKHEREQRRRELVQRYAPRRPMTQLPDRYRVTSENPTPPLFHFAFPVAARVLYRYALKQKLNKYSPMSMFFATDHLSEHVQYELECCFPLAITAESDVVVELYSNYTMEDKMLIDEDQEDVIQMVQEALELDESVRPKWYFDVHDSWEPGDDEEDG